MSSEGVQTVASLGVPHFDEVVVGAGDDELAVVLHAAHGGEVPDKHAQAAPVRNRPHAQRRVTGPRYHPANITWLNICLLVFKLMIKSKNAAVT